MARHKTHTVKVGKVKVGGSSPVVVQAMTNTNTADIEASVTQVIELSEAGAEIVRLTVNNEEAARATPRIKEKLLKSGYDTPLVGCFHYNGHTLLTKYSECAKALDKYRINPGNVGFGTKRDRNFEQVIETALKFEKPVRIGANWGSLDQQVLARMIDENNKLSLPLSYSEIEEQALISSALESAQKAENIGMPSNRIILSAKVSKVQALISVYRKLAKDSNYALHLGLTEAGMGLKGITATSAALSVLLAEGIGDTIRASITPSPGETRIKEVQLCQEVLQSLQLRSFAPQVSACPGCGRTSSTYFQTLAAEIQEFLHSSMPYWKNKYKGVEKLNVAVMGCIVNGPGESKHADIGISLPGNGENPIAPVFVDGKKQYTLRGEDISTQFKTIVEEYISSKFGT